MKKTGEERSFFETFKSNISQWINNIKALYLCQTNADYLVYHIYKNNAIIAILTVSKPKKSGVDHFVFRERKGHLATWRLYKKARHFSIEIGCFNGNTTLSAFRIRDAEKAKNLDIKAALRRFLPPRFSQSQTLRQIFRKFLTEMKSFIPEQYNRVLLR